MIKKTETEILKESIVFLQNKQEQELLLLREQVHVTIEGFKPVNLLKNTLQEVSSSSYIKSNLVSGIIGLSTGYIAKKILIGASKNPIRKLLGTIFQFGIASVFTKKSEPEEENKPETSNMQ